MEDMVSEDFHSTHKEMVRTIKFLFALKHTLSCFKLTTTGMLYHLLILSSTCFLHISRSEPIE